MTVSTKRTLFLVLFAVLASGGIFLGAGRQERNQLPYQRTYDFKGARMSYQVLGKGKPVILVHGSMYADPWKGFEKRLADSRQVYLPHLPGFGASDAVEGELHDTGLFSEALCVFVDETDLRKAPVVAFSLGTIVAAKAAARGCLEGKLILVGMPGQVSGWRAKLAQSIPLFWRRILVATRWGKEKLLIPALRENVGEADEARNEDFIADLLTTDPRSIVDPDYKKEVEEELPRAFSQITNEIIFIYGELDKQREAGAGLIEGYLSVSSAEHNIFRSRPEKSFEMMGEIF